MVVPLSTVDPCDPQVYGRGRIVRRMESTQFAACWRPRQGDPVRDLLSLKPGSGSDGDSAVENAREGDPGQVRRHQVPGDAIEARGHLDVRGHGAPETDQIGQRRPRSVCAEEQRGPSSIQPEDPLPMRNAFVRSGESGFR